MNAPHRLCLCAAFAVGLAGAGHAQESGQTFQAVPSSPDLIFTLRGGGQLEPEFFGSDEYDIGPNLGFNLNFLRLPGGRSFGSPDPLFEPEGFRLRGSFRFIDERDELDGFDDVDTSVELGLGLAYDTQFFGAYADVRYGVIGHDSFVGELGANVKMRPTDRLTLTLGPRVFLGDDDYADTYFGVSATDSALSGLGEFDADGGVLSAGVELGAKYRINNNWGIEGSVRYDRLTGDAEDSSITEAGDEDQFTVKFGLTRRITLDF